MKLDDTNYLFSQESSDNSAVLSGDSSTRVPSDEYKIWKMHDKALMQLITTTLSPAAISYAIGSTSSKDLWTQLKEQLSTIIRTNIFQLKSELQTIKKDNDSITLYLQKIKEARDFFTAAGVIFKDDHIVILTLNGLPAEFNTITSVIRGHETIISLKDLRSQLLVEETLPENASASLVLSALMAQNNGFTPKNQSFYNSGGNHVSPNSNAYKYFINRKKAEVGSIPIPI
ncbi:uncharacterized protein [Malus domestica]|uniref:uncharacterized protein n=1 Tax=Malus domestica TaxID=3750 RepID=UPI000498DF4B